jgi:predicted dehydrogenase
MKKYTVAQAGCGNRGKIHIKGFKENSDRFEMVGLCDLNETTLKDAAEKYGIKAPLYTDTEKMLEETKPDVFCFVTLPNIRKSMIELGAKHKVKGIVFEKPMATSLKEAKYITDLCNKNKIKAVICHQHKYLKSMQKLKSIVDSGDIGEVSMIHVNTQAWVSELGTHYMDYALWINGIKKAKWVVGHVNGRKGLTDIHPSPDFADGTVLLENGVRIYFECGYLSQKNLTTEEFWFDDRLAVYGTHGYAWAECNGAWAAFTRSSGGELMSGQEEDFLTSEIKMQVAYTKDFADWLDDDNKIHPNNIDISYHGFEILEGMFLSALDYTRIDFPITDFSNEDSIKRMLRVLPEVKTY